MCQPVGILGLPCDEILFISRKPVHLRKGQEPIVPVLLIEFISGVRGFKLPVDAAFPVIKTVIGIDSAAITLVKLTAVYGKAVCVFRESVDSHFLHTGRQGTDWERYLGIDYPGAVLEIGEQCLGSHFVSPLLVKITHAGQRGIIEVEQFEECPVHREVFRRRGVAVIFREERDSRDEVRLSFSADGQPRKRGLPGRQGDIENPSSVGCRFRYRIAGKVEKIFV